MMSDMQMWTDRLQTEYTNIIQKMVVGSNHFIETVVVVCGVVGTEPPAIDGLAEPCTEANVPI